MFCNIKVVVCYPVSLLRLLNVLAHISFFLNDPPQAFNTFKELKANIRKERSEAAIRVTPIEVNGLLLDLHKKTTRWERLCIDAHGSVFCFEVQYRKT